MIVERSSRCELFTDWGMTSGLSGIIAEMEIEEDGNSLFLYCEWVDGAPDELGYEAAERSIFAYLTMREDDEENERWRMLDIDPQGHYGAQFEKLRGMVFALAEEEQIDFGIFDPEAEKEEEQEATVQVTMPNLTRDAEFRRMLSGCRFALLTRTTDGEERNVPLRTEEELLDYANREWIMGTQVLGLSYEEFRACTVTIGWTEDLQPVYSVHEVLRDYVQMG